MSSRDQKHVFWGKGCSSTSSSIHLNMNNDEDEYPDFAYRKSEYDKMVVYNISPALDDLLFSCTIFLVTVYVCNLIRELILFSRALDDLRDAHMYKLLVAELIGTIEAAVACYEINFIIYDVFGVLAYSIAIFLVGMWQAQRAPEYEYDGNPLIVLVKYIEAVHPLRQHQFESVDPLYQKIEFVTFMIIVQSFSAFIAFLALVNFAWKNAKVWTFWEETNYHLTRYKLQDEWSSSISGTVEFAAFVEGFYSMVIYLWPFYIRYRGFSGNSAIVLVEAGKAAFSGFGTSYSGAYFNPVLGFTLEFHTGGPSSLAKFVVYCVAPVFGTLIGIFVGGIDA